MFAIGIDKYKNNRFNTLFNAVSDVNNIIEVLTGRYNFELIEPPIFNENATRENITNGLNNLLPSITKDDNLVIYFAGHGEKHGLTGHGYWVPYDGNDLVSSYIPNSIIKDAIEGIEAQHTFLISDSCFSGTFLTRTRSATEVFFYDKLDALKSRWVFASGGEEKVSDGFEAGKGSPFCNELLSILKNNSNKYLSVTQVINYVSISTKRIAKQQPIGGYIENVDHQDGQMIFVLDDKYITEKQYLSFTLESEPIEVIKTISSISTGKEVLIINSFVDQFDYMIIELFRFDDDGSIRHTFKENIVESTTPGKDGEKFNYLLTQRFATWKGVERYLAENKESFKGKKIGSWPARDDIDDIEDTYAAKAQFKKLQQLRVSNTTPMNCLHCGKKIFSNDSLYIEIDEIGLNPALGNVHKECLRAADRILGKTLYADLKEESKLINFDFEEWISLLKRGQGFITAVKNRNYKIDTPTISWNPDHKFNFGTYCILITAEDGDVSYVHLGKEIHRIKEMDIDSELEFFRQNLRKSKLDGDPISVTSKKRTFGHRSTLLNILDTDEEILEITSFEKTKYSNQLTQTNRNIDNDYAPMGLVINPVTEEIVKFGKYIPLLSSPLDFDNFHLNWNEAGFTLGNCEVRIIKSDGEFDHYLMAFLADGMQPLLDPIFDKHGNFIKGYYIANFKDLTKETSINY